MHVLSTYKSAVQAEFTLLDSSKREGEVALPQSGVGGKLSYTLLSYLRVEASYKSLCVLQVEEAGREVT